LPGELDVPLCHDDYSPMVPVKAVVQSKKRKR
jgi:hypothetical protein